MTHSASASPAQTFPAIRPTSALTVPANSLPARLDAARTALAAATDDYQRIRIRDAAAAIKAAAEVWGAKDIALAAAELVRDAEIDLANANPAPTPEEAGRRGGRGKKKGVSATDTPLPKQTKKALRASVLPPAEEEKLRAECREEGVAVTRALLRERAKEWKTGLKAEARARRQAEAREAAKTAPPAPNLFHCPVAELHRFVLAGSVDFIVTDPPYHDKYVAEGIWKDLAAFASHSLRPGGALLTVVPTRSMPQVLVQLACPGLVWRWMVAYVMRAGQSHIHSGKVKTKWKGVAVYTRRGAHPADYSNDLLEEVIDAGPIDPREKDVHELGQTPAGMANLIREWVREPGSIVCDPLAGGGALLVEAKRLGHRVVGADIDAGYVETTRRKLAAVTPAAAPKTGAVDSFVGGDAT